MNLSNDRGKKPFVSLQFCFFASCILNIVPIALITLKQPLREENFFRMHQLNRQNFCDPSPFSSLSIDILNE